MEKKVEKRAVESGDLRVSHWAEMKAALWVVKLELMMVSSMDAKRVDMMDEKLAI